MAINAVHIIVSFTLPLLPIIMIPRHEEVELPRILCFQERVPSEVKRAFLHVSMDIEKFLTP